MSVVIRVHVSFNTKLLGLRMFGTRKLARNQLKMAGQEIGKSIGVGVGVGGGGRGILGRVTSSAGNAAADSLRSRRPRWRCPLAIPYFLTQHVIMVG